MEEEGSYVLFIYAKEFQGLNDQDINSSKEAARNVSVDVFGIQKYEILQQTIIQQMF